MNQLVSIITRTKDRLIFLPRVFETVVKQSYRPLEWIIVNDNGEKIDNLIEELKLQYDDELDRVEIFIINKKVSTTMEATSNVGLEHAHGDYIKILDDDDTLDFTCIEKQVNYMQNKKLPSERGVVCYAQKIFENIEDNQLHILNTIPWNVTPSHMTIADIADYNQFAPVSFLYERDVHNNIGLYNETLPVLGDWEFNLRFIINYDIGVLPEVLANYHIRENLEGVSGNTIATDHHRYYAIICNQFIRNEKEYPNIAAMVSNAPGQRKLQGKLDTILQAVNSSAALVNDQQQQIMAQQQQIKEEEQQIMDQQQQIMDQQQQIMDQQQQIMDQQQQIRDQQQQVDNLRDELNLIFTSKSWRYTGIIRKLKQKVLNLFS